MAATCSVVAAACETDIKKTASRRKEEDSHLVDNRGHFTVAGLPVCRGVGGD